MFKNKGFTLIEVVAVVVMIGILLGLAAPYLSQFPTMASSKVAATVRNNFKKQLDLAVAQGMELPTVTLKNSFDLSGDLQLNGLSQIDLTLKADGSDYRVPDNLITDADGCKKLLAVFGNIKLNSIDIDSSTATEWLSFFQVPSSSGGRAPLQGPPPPSVPRSCKYTYVKTGQFFTYTMSTNEVTELATS